MMPRLDAEAAPPEPTGAVESAARRALLAWGKGEGSGDYSEFRAMLAPGFRLFSHPVLERGLHAGPEARERLEALIASRETAPNGLRFSNVTVTSQGDVAVVLFDSAGTLSGGAAYSGYNAIAFLIDDGQVAGFREYFGDLPPEWLRPR